MNKNFLIIEDNKEFSSFINEYINKHKLINLKVSTSNHAIDIIKKENFDLLFINYYNDTNEIKKYIQTILKNNLYIPFVVYNGENDAQIAVDIMKYGAIDYIIKEDDFYQLIKKIDNIANQLQSLSQIELPNNLKDLFNITNNKLQINLNHSNSNFFNLVARSCFIVTQKQLYEDIIANSEIKYHELFDNMINGIAVMEAIDNGDDYIINDFNKAAEKIENISYKNKIKSRLSSIISKTENSILFDKIKEVYLYSTTNRFQYQYKQNSEIVGWRDYYIYKLPTNEIVAIFDDITDIKRSNEALIESEERYRSFVQNFKGIAFRWTKDYVPYFFHGSVEQITGYNPDDFINGNIKWNQIIHPEDYPSVNLFGDKIGILPNYEHEFEYRIITKDGNIKWVHEHLQNICDKSGNLLYIQGTISNVNNRKENEEELKKSREQLRNLTIHLESAREDERKRIALEIHDELGHALTVMKMDMAWLLKKKFLKQEVLIEKIQQISSFIESTIKKVRSISSQLRPSVLDHFGLIAAIEWQTKEFQKQTAIRCRFSLMEDEVKLEEYRSTAVFRIFQEILTNVARHSKASRVDISIEKIDNELILRVSDNGKGIRQDQISSKKSFGILGMFERTNSISANMTINGIADIGTTVTLRLPIKI